jgi:hypothetical protein
MKAIEEAKAAMAEEDTPHPNTQRRPQRGCPSKDREQKREAKEGMK